MQEKSQEEFELRTFQFLYNAIIIQIKMNEFSSLLIARAVELSTLAINSGPKMFLNFSRTETLKNISNITFALYLLETHPVLCSSVYLW